MFLFFISIYEILILCIFKFKGWLPTNMLNFCAAFDFHESINVITEKDKYYFKYCKNQHWKPSNNQNIIHFFGLHAIK